jgi:AraC-like DNA-binding protein
VRTVSCATSVGTLYVRTRELTSDGNDSVGIVVNSGRRAVVAHRGREIALGPDEAIPIFTQDPARLTATRHIGLLFPRAALASRIRDIDSLARGPIPRRSEPLRLLMSYIRMVSESAAPETPNLRDVVVSHIHDLAALALGPHPQKDYLSAVAAARLNAALALIKANFSNPDLTVMEIARRQNISPRHLQRLLESTGRSFSTYVNDLRLDRAYALIRELRNDPRRISDIALQAGFSDISHFNRLFRARFGATPSDVRHGARRSLDA